MPGRRWLVALTFWLLPVAEAPAHLGEPALTPLIRHAAAMGPLLQTPSVVPAQSPAPPAPAESSGPDTATMILVAIAAVTAGAMSSRWLRGWKNRKN